MSGTDATSSFSGYLYQADVALLVALEKIISLKDTPDELNKWFLEVEGEEDFTLIKKEGVDVVEKHSYQVKETSGKKPSDYTLAVIKLYQVNSGVTHYSYLVTERDLSTEPKISFFDGLYNGGNLTDAKEKVNYFGESILLGPKMEEVTLPNNGKKFKFKDGETKTTIQAHIESETRGFLYSNFNYLYKGTWTEIHTQIIDCFKSIKSNISDPDNYLRYFESQIKRYIQENKGILITSRIALNLRNDIFNKIVDFDHLTFSQEDYRWIFEDGFIRIFREEFDKFRIRGDSYLDGLISTIHREIGADDSFNELLDEIILSLSQEVFGNAKKCQGLIELTICNSIIEEFILDEELTFEKVINTSGFNKDSITQKIHLLIMYFFAKRYNSSIKDEFFIGSNDYLHILYGNYRGILTGLPNNPRKRCREFLKTHLFYRFENTHLGISCSTDCTLDEFLGNTGKTGESDFFESDIIIKKKHQDYNCDITKSKEIRIFGGTNCLSTNAHEFMI